MSMSDCEKCWDTPCMCGYDYRNWDIKRLIELRNVLDKIIQERKAPTGGMHFSSESEVPKPDLPDDEGFHFGR